MLPTYFINHGGGPCFFVSGAFREAWSELEAYLASFQQQQQQKRLPEKPQAILLISAHWEEDVPTVNAGAAPNLLYDYYGFPDHTYKLSFPVPGAPALAHRVVNLLTEAGIQSKVNTDRGWDHGVFVPLLVMYPKVGDDDDDVPPIVQLSILRNLDPASHIAMGRALKPLRDEGVLIIGSGQSYHNLQGLRCSQGHDDGAAQAFDDWLCDTMVHGDPALRDEALVQWERAPGARQSQPREDHLLPLMVVAGAAHGEPGFVDWRGQAMDKPLSGFRFGA
jgi:aromatic ring-opening dioxygenase catalytic subunit (LigB family)